MSNGNFPNGTLVIKVWSFDGCSEMVSKFQYWNDAVLFCEAMLVRDKENGSNKDRMSWFYIAVCDYECKSQGFGLKEEV